jgi:hypothetical protein
MTTLASELVSSLAKPKTSAAAATPRRAHGIRKSVMVHGFGKGLCVREEREREHAPVEQLKLEPLPETYG